MTRSKVKSRSRQDVAHLHPLTNVPTKYQRPTPYSFRDTARTKFSNSRSHHDPLTNVPTPYQVQTSYTLRILRYKLDKLFPAARPPIRTPWMKTIP